MGSQSVARDDGLNGRRAAENSSPRNPTYTPDSITVPAHWYLLQTKRHEEAFVCRLLQSDGVRTYLPLVQVRPKNRRAAAEKPWFPGYVFVRLDPGKQSLNAVNWTPGTQGLVELAGEPAVVSDGLIRTLKTCIARHDPGEPHPTRCSGSRAGIGSPQARLEKSEAAGREGFQAMSTTTLPKWCPVSRSR